MKFDITKKRFNPVWLIVGAITGRAFGLIFGMNVGFWHVAEPGVVITWQVLGVVAFALLTSFMMTSDIPVQTRWTLLGFTIGFALAAYGTEIWSLGLSEREVQGLRGITVGEGIFLEWMFLHAGLFGGIAGWITGAAWNRKQNKQTDITTDGLQVESADTP